MFAPLGFMPGMTKEQVAAVAGAAGGMSAGVPKVEHYINMGGWFAGTSDELVAFLKNLEARYPGLEHINLSTPMGTPQSIMLDQYRRVTAEVMPHFRR